MCNWRNTMKRPAGPTLTAAAKHNDAALTEALLQAEDVDVDVRDERQHSALMLAAYGGHLAIVALLLRYGADPNATDSSGNTVLMCAAFNGHIDTVRLLLGSGADPTRTNAAGMDAPAFAAQFGRLEVLPLLQGSVRESQHGSLPNVEQRGAARGATK